MKHISMDKVQFLETIVHFNSDIRDGLLHTGNMHPGLSLPGCKEYGETTRKYLMVTTREWSACYNDDHCFLIRQ
jgi:hypothetical protein